MTLHEKAKTSLKDENLTTELLNKRNDVGSTVWHIAAQYGTLKDIPFHLLTTEAFALKNVFGDSVFHDAAHWVHSLKSIPEHLFTAHTFKTLNHGGFTVCDYVARYETLKYIPKSFITLDLFNFCKKNTFTDIETQYIENISQLRSKLNDFIKTNPTLEKDITFRDPRLDIENIDDNAVCFSFEEIGGKVVLSKDGITFGKNLYKSLNDAVCFIESNYPVERSIALPVNNALTVEHFVL